MNGIIDRNMIAHLIVILGACIGAWMWQVEPRAKELDNLQTQIAQQQTTTTTLTPQLLEAAVKRLDQAKARLAEIEASNQLADDSSRFYGLVMDLADQHNVQIKSLQPRLSQKPHADAVVLTTRIDLVIEGTYMDVANFLEEMNDLPVFTTPLSLQLSPTIVNNKPMTIANFGCGVMKFVIPPKLAAMAGDTRVNH